MGGRWGLAHAAGMTLSLVLVPFASAMILVTVGAASLARFVWVERPRALALGFGVANLVTALRVALVVSTAALPKAAAAAVFLLVLALDGVDGAVARARNEVSAFGAQLDLETDAFFVAVLSATVCHSGAAGPWVLVAGGLRYALVLARATLPSVAAGERRSRFGRWAYGLSVASLSAALLDWPTPMPTALSAVAVGVLCASFWGDFRLLRFSAAFTPR